MKKADIIGITIVASLLAGNIVLASDYGKNLIQSLMPNYIPLARAIFGESRNSVELQIAAGNTILNRVEDERWPDSIDKVVYQTKQFSCFNPDDPNYPKVWNPEKYEPKAWQRSKQIAKALMRGKHPDNTKGANHYHTTKVNPKWSRGKKPTVKVGSTKFFKL